MFYVILLLSAFLLFVLLSSKVSIRILDYYIEIRINLAGCSLVIKKINVKEIDWLSLAERTIEEKLDIKDYPALQSKLLKYFSENVLPAIKANKEILRKIHCKRLKANIVWGSTDPAITGIIFGLINTIMSTLVIVVSQIFISDFYEPEFSVEANFKIPQITWQLDCIFEISLVHIITAGLKTFIAILKNKIS